MSRQALNTGQQSNRPQNEDGAELPNRRESTTRTRKDKNRVHSTRHGVLSRYPLQILINLGESKRRLLKIEKNFLADLEPRGTIGNALFDRMFCAYLRELLAGKMEAQAMAMVDSSTPRDGMRAVGISAQELPTLIFSADSQRDLVILSPNLWTQIALVQKYDTYYSREFFRCLGLLLVLKNGGEAALAKCVSKVLGTHKDPLEG